MMTLVFEYSSKNSDADFLVLNYHYSKRLSALNRLVCFAWDNETFVSAAAFFGHPVNNWPEPLIELTRLVRDPDFSYPFTGLLSYSIKSLRNLTTDFSDLIISYADSTHGHHGGIYQAASWNFHCKRKPSCDGFTIDGKFIPRRTVYKRYKTRGFSKASGLPGFDLYVPHGEIYRSGDYETFLRPF